ncbi:MAG: hypothetical protein AABZ06_11480 [Bdellovibrionota bacterium]
MKSRIAICLGLIGLVSSTVSFGASLSGDLQDQTESAKQFLQSYPQCDYAHPDFCYELIRNGCSGSGYGYNYGSYGSYGGGGYGCGGSYGSYSSPYSPYSPYSNPYNPYNYQYSEGSLKIRYSLDDVDTQDGFIGVHNNKIFYSPDLQRLFEPSNTAEASK